MPQHFGNYPADPLTASDSVMVEHAPARSYVIIPGLNGAPGQRTHGLTGGQGPENPFTGKGFNIASRITNGQYSFRRRPERPPRQQRRAAPAEPSQVRDW